MYDLLIRGGRVIDAANDIDAVMDVAVSGGLVAEVADTLDSGLATEEFDARGKIVTPGLVDVHVHVYGPGDVVPADPNCGVGAGVTSVIDAGSADASCIDDLVERVVSKTESSVYSLLTNHHWPDGFGSVGRAPPVDYESVKRAVADHQDVVVGLKIAMTPAIHDSYGLEALRSARQVAEELGLRVMLHIGDIGNPALEPTSSKVTADALAMLEAGDILTHIYSPLTGGPLDEDEVVIPALHDAIARGVVMDAAIGDYGFGWEAADKILADGIRADTISSDVELYSAATDAGGLMVEGRRATGNRVVSELSLVEYMSYFLTLGFSVTDIIKMTTCAPAKAAGISCKAGDLTPGKPADVAVLELKTGRYSLADVTGEIRVGEQAFVPVATLKGGVIHKPGPGPHEWGFEPPAAH